MEVDDQVFVVGTLPTEKRTRSPDKRIKFADDSEEEEEDQDDVEYKPPGFKQKKVAKDKKQSKSKINRTKKQEHKVWTCRRCLEEFTSRRDLTEHTKTYHPEENKDVHTFKYDEEQDIYTCCTCSAEYQTKSEVEEHISKIHEEFYTCEICKHISKKAYTFAVHMKIHSTDDTYTCPLCSYNTPRRTCLQTHINRVHYHKFYYTCPTCGKGFNDSVIFKEHNNEHLGIKPFICVVCNKCFVYSRYMLIHQTRYHTVHIEGTLHKTQCSICLKVFSKVATLLKHITTKHNSNNSDKPEKRHLCDMCGKGFGTSDKLKIHYRIHTGEKPFYCRYCEKRFTKKDYLIMHERVHTGEKPYPCEYCGKCFNQAASLRIHVRGHTGERPYICQFCNGGYISRGSLNLHLKICNGVTMFVKIEPLNYECNSDDDYKPTNNKKSKRKTKSNIEDNKPKRQYNFNKLWPCKKCGKVCSTRRKLLEHTKDEHKQKDFDEHSHTFDPIQDLYVCNTCSAEYTDLKEADEHVKTHEENFKCTVCNQKFKKIYDFGTHNYTHDPEKLFRCPLCSYTSSKRTGFLVHVNYTHLKKFGYVCETCGKGFNDLVLFKEHNNEHLGIKPFTCVVCSKMFTYSRYLLTHQVRYHRVGIEGQLLPNQCSLCSKVFSKLSTLEKHLEERHTKSNLPRAKKHLCDTCGKGFAQKNKLRIHYRVHTGFKPYTCTYCAKSFTKKDYLVMHERVHSGEKPYSCEYCGKCFSQGAPLRIHLRTHTGERPYVCQICNAGFTSRGALNIHFKHCNGSV